MKMEACYSTESVYFVMSIFKVREKYCVSDKKLMGILKNNKRTF